ncbi:MAG: hypothetical protein WC767_02090 [Candidatus Paceibacterota bacterium]|jgi:hypothetical protein
MKKMVNGIDVSALRRRLVSRPDSTRMVSHQTLLFIARRSKTAQMIVRYLVEASLKFVRYTQRYWDLFLSHPRWSRSFGKRCARFKRLISTLMGMLSLFLGRVRHWPFRGVSAEVIAQKLVLTSLPAAA